MSQNRLIEGGNILVLVTFLFIAVTHYFLELIHPGQLAGGIC